MRRKLSVTASQTVKKEISVCVAALLFAETEGRWRVPCQKIVEAVKWGFFHTSECVIILDIS